VSTPVPLPSLTPDSVFERVHDIIIAANQCPLIGAFYDLLKAMQWKDPRKRPIFDDVASLSPLFKVQQGHVFPTMNPALIPARWRAMVESGFHREVLQHFLKLSEMPGSPLRYSGHFFGDVGQIVELMYGTFPGVDAETIFRSWVGIHRRRVLHRIVLSQHYLTGLERCHPALIAVWSVDGIGEFVQEGYSLDPLHRLLDRHAKEPVLDLARARLALVEGRLDDATRLLLGRTDEASAEVFAMLALMRGDAAAAARHFQRAIAFDRATGGDGDFVFAPASVLMPLAYLSLGQAARTKTVEVSNRRVATRWTGPSKAMELWIQRMIKKVKAEPLGAPPPLPEGTWYLLAAGLISRWTALPLPEKELRVAWTQARAAGHVWVAAELALLLGEAEPAMPPGCRSLLSLFESDTDWEQALALLEGALKPAGMGPGGAKSRVAWLVEAGGAFIELIPVLQNATKGGWTKGRAIALNRVVGGRQSVPEMTDQDAALVSALYPAEVVTYGRGFSVGLVAGLRAIMGHPALLDASDPSLSLRVELREPILRVDPSGTGVSLKVVPAPPVSGEAVASRPRPDLFELCSFSPLQLRLARLIGNGLVFPEAGRERLQALLRRVDGVFPVLDPSQTVGGSVVAMEADPRLIVTLKPEGSGLLAQVSVAPLGPQGPRLVPGQPPASTVARIGEQTQACERDLRAEQAALVGVVQAQPFLGVFLAEEPLLTTSLEESLELMSALRALGDTVGVEWPEGGELKLRDEVGVGAMRLQVRKAGAWFEATGQLAIGGDQSLPLDELMRILEVGRTRFVRLNDGQFLALTEQLRRRLQRLARLGARHKGALRLHAMATPALLDLSDEGLLSGDAGWQTHLARLRSPPPPPPLPAGLNAALRPYQEAGFAWMCRLTDMGLGGILADDMGLGKTVQALAFLLHRSADGPSLVVAPTSVCAGWAEQAATFAPGLRVLRFGEGDREEALGALGPGDLVVCSYGLLVSEIERLSKIPFSALILDEAQAIKNADTLRHQCVAKIQARQRFALSGTPVENHVGELWAQMELLNPGALGTWGSFRSRFAEPVSQGDVEAREALRRLLLPFVLRRTKAMVLSDLPPRTDVVVPITLEPAARLAYEALREHAIEEMSKKEGANPLAVLAWLTRLRLFCCHPALALGDDTGLPAAKLESFIELVTELRENKHRTLVFSQFVKHLDRLRVWLDAEKIPYQYLDGATPARERAARVAAFQAGQGDLFLISLKAGGTGLNLTAADYVVHMDPWWNPAVEDQASDRAHRIGQLRPVTVYRLVTQGTVEEQILALHRDKRDLADQLLDGTGASAALSAEELVALLKGGVASRKKGR